MTKAYAHLSHQCRWL